MIVQREQKKCNRILNKIFDHLIDELKTLKRLCTRQNASDLPVILEALCY